MPTVQVRDIEMYYRETGRVDGQPLVLLHGFTATGQMFDAYLEALGRRYRLYVPDLRGHGRTTNPKEEISHAGLAQDTAAFVKAMGLSGAHFCGVSSGGMQLTFLALEQPELVYSLTYAAATYTFDDYVKGQAQEVAATASDRWLAVLERDHEPFHGPGYARRIIQLWLEAVLRPDELPFTRNELGRISCPTLIIHGDRDPFFPLEVPVTMYQAIPNAELCVIPECGHNITHDNRLIFASTLGQFLEKQAKG